MRDPALAARSMDGGRLTAVDEGADTERAVVPQAMPHVASLSLDYYNSYQHDEMDGVFQRGLLFAATSAFSEYGPHTPGDSVDTYDDGADDIDRIVSSYFSAHTWSFGFENEPSTSDADINHPPPACQNAYEYDTFNELNTPDSTDYLPSLIPEATYNLLSSPESATSFSSRAKSSVCSSSQTRQRANCDSCSTTRAGLAYGARGKLYYPPSDECDRIYGNCGREAGYCRNGPVLSC
ncbi:hypothetical protein EJ02DRAFT_455011 [Clathrospora elynae]|uniref:Uncharacterized protein n=1 Tax=Clathrospora elynae TaxID=706981 RepID=A0A6A5SLU8_9PLEO|nr:hypothetical protein EJ02DRAFT_455011 [Clathrospora elynae]